MFPYYLFLLRVFFRSWRFIYLVVVILDLKTATMTMGQVIKWDRFKMLDDLYFSSFNRAFDMVSKLTMRHFFLNSWMKSSILTMKARQNRNERKNLVKKWSMKKKTEWWHQSVRLRINGNTSQCPSVSLCIQIEIRLTRILIFNAPK